MCRCAGEIIHVERWADENNLSLNQVKSAEIVLVSQWSKRAVVIPSSAVPGIERVDSIKVLGVTVSCQFSVTDHVDNLLAACAQTTFAMRTLKQHGLPANAIRAIFQATVVAKLSYASPTWWGFASAADKDRLEAFLRRSGQLEYREKSAPTLASICDEAEGRLFNNILSNSQHLLHHLLSPHRDEHYGLRERATHNLQI
jgi:hypothetical protein